jgi:large subunit ribosomal protein L33
MRVLIRLECSECKNKNYSVTKNKIKQPERIEQIRYCSTCNKRTLHKESR